jgi:hypothetical protein
VKRFAIQAVVDERQLYDVMRYLENSRASDILARPCHIDGAEPTKEAPAKRRENGSGAAQVRIAVMAALAAGETVVAKEIRDKTGVDQSAINNAFHRLHKARIIKRVGYGKYTKGAGFNKAATKGREAL